MVQKISTNLQVIASESIEKAVANELESEDKDLESLLEDEQENDKANTESSEEAV